MFQVLFRWSLQELKCAFKMFVTLGTYSFSGFWYALYTFLQNSGIRTASSEWSTQTQKMNSLIESLPVNTQQNLRGTLKKKSLMV